MKTWIWAETSQSGPQEFRVIGLQVIFIDLQHVFVSLGAQQGLDGMVYYTPPEHYSVRATVVRRKCLKCCAHLRASKSTSRGSEDVQLHNNELEYITYLAGDPKRKEWGSSCWHSVIYEPTYKVPSNVNWMSIYVKYMSNTNKGKWNNETNKRNKRKQKKEPRGVSRSEGLKTLSLRIRRFKDFEHHVTLWDVTRQIKCLELKGLKTSKIVRRLRKLFSGFMRGFSLQWGSTILGACDAELHMASQCDKADFLRHCICAFYILDIGKKLCCIEE